MDRSLHLNILKPGMQTTIQDHGREVFRAFGVPKSGFMDQGSACLSNRLVGNPEFYPVMEFTLIGPELELEGEGKIALTGASFNAMLDNQPLALNRCHQLTGKHRLSLGQVQNGCRGYLAIAGDWQITPWLGSCSTSSLLSNQLTPGSVITKGQRITVTSNIKQGSTEETSSSRIAKVPGSSRNPTFDAMRDQIELIAGPEYGLFEVPVIKELFAKSFRVSAQSNRMGYRLEPSLKDYRSPIEIISSGVVPGTIQVTHGGQLIVLMADAQTTGGYPRIANVLNLDLDILAQKKPGDLIRFRLAPFNRF